MNLNLTIINGDINTFFQCDIVSYFFPYVQIFKNNLSVNGDIEIPPVCAIQSSSGSIPRFDKIKFYFIISVLNRKLESKLINSISKGLQQFPIFCVLDWVPSSTLACVKGRNILKIIRPRGGSPVLLFCFVNIAMPNISKTIGVSWATCVDSIYIISTIFRD